MKDREEIKKFHFDKENHNKEAELEQIKKQFIMKFRTLKDIIKEYPKKEMTLKEKELSEMAKEFIKLCQKRYGEEMQKIEEEKNETKIKERYQILNSLVHDLYQFNHSIENYFEKRGINPKRKMEGYIVSIGNTKTETIVQHTEPNLTSFIKIDDEEQEK